MAKYLFIFVILFWVSTVSQAQEKIIQFSGQIFYADSNRPIMGVRVTNLNKVTMDISDDNGWFTVVASSGDNIQLSHLGMEHQYYKIPAEADKTFFKEFRLTINPYELEAVEINLPALEELEDYLMSLNIDKDSDREFALKHPDMFNILDTIIAHEPKLLSFKNGKIESSPISYIYEKVYKKIKARMRKPNKKETLPKFIKSDKKKKKDVQSDLND